MIMEREECEANNSSGTGLSFDLEHAAAQTVSSPQMQDNLLLCPIDHAAASTPQPSLSVHTSHPFACLGGKNDFTATDHTELLLPQWNEFFIQKDPGGAVTRDAAPYSVKVRGWRRLVKKSSEGTGLSFDLEHAPPKEYHPGLQVKISKHHRAAPYRHRADARTRRCGQSGVRLRRGGRQGDSDHRDASIDHQLTVKTDYEPAMDIPQIDAPAAQTVSSPQMQDNLLLSPIDHAAASMPQPSRSVHTSHPFACLGGKNDVAATDHTELLLQQWNEFFIQKDPGVAVTRDAPPHSVLGHGWRRIGKRISKELFDALCKDVNQLLEASPDILREYLIHLQDYMVNTISASNSTRNIQAVIEFLLIILYGMPDIHCDILLDLLPRIRSISREVSILVCEKLRNEESSYVIDCEAVDMLKNIKLLKGGDLRRIFLKTPADSFQFFCHMSDGPLYMHLLLINLNDLLISRDYSVALIKEEIVLVKEGLELLRSFFGNVEQEAYKDLWTQVLDVAYEAEHFISTILVGSDDCLLYLISLPDIIEKIQLIKKKVIHLPEKISKNMGLNIVNFPKKPGVSNSSSLVDQVIVGFEEETDFIIRKLTSGPTEIDVISIIGMPGAGKTTLASRVYNNTFVASHFDVRAWCTVDQERNEKKLLQNIFDQVFGSKEACSKDALDNDIGDKLRKKLFAKRYLIVLDDLWDTATVDELTRNFPEFQKGSRIILTSRIKDVALRRKCYSDPLYLRLFRVEESWSLLQKRVFGEESCPLELLDVGKEIAQNCGGLPLVADLIAGVMVKQEKKRTSWLQILNNLNALVLKNEVDVMKVIQLSYDHLAVHLKSCLLYLASYPKDKQIKVTDLKEFWAAEGFVEQTDVRSVEKLLEVYLDSLISSSLVVGGRLLGKETCQIHDLVHDFCLIKAREENLFGFITSSVRSSASDMMPRRMIIPCDQLYRNSHNSVDMFNSEKRSIDKVIVSVKVDAESWQINQLRHLRLLRVLCLGKIDLTDSLLNEIGQLVHLRYLEVMMVRVKGIPLSWSNLWNLETLVVCNYNPYMVLLPRIWNLAKLRRVSIAGCWFFKLGINEPTLLAKDSELEYLRKLEGVNLSYRKDREDIFERFPHLQILNCIIRETPEKFSWFPNLDVLNELEELHATFIGNFQCDLHFPRSLKMLSLSRFHVTSDSLSTISRLPNLQTLELLDLKIQGGEWNVGENGTFMNLKSLQLSNVALSEWVVQVDSFPVLEELHLVYCLKLKEIPSSFGDINSLKSINIVVCRRQLGVSALKIKEYVAEITGEDKLHVKISWGFRTKD